MSTYELREEGKFPMFLYADNTIGGLDHEGFTAEAHENGHPTEELRPLGTVAVEKLLELVPNPDN